MHSLPSLPIAAHAEPASLCPLAVARAGLAVALGLSLTIGAPDASSQSLITEGWQRSNCGTYVPQSGTDVFIQGDAATWYVGDTASECGPSGNRAEIVCSGSRKFLRLTTVTNNEGCAENLFVAPINGPTINITPSTRLSITETGTLIAPEWGSWHPFPTCCPPPGDCVFLRISDVNGNMLVYLFQRSPEYFPHTTTFTVALPTGGTGQIGYHEIFLDAWDSPGGTYQRNLYEDFLQVPRFSPTGARIGEVVFQITSVGTATMDDLQFGAVQAICPAITTPPQSVSTTNGGAFTLTAAASGTSPLLWQWRLNGTPLPGETNTWLSVTSASAAHAGAYQAVVCNSCGCATSQVAQVTVLGAPQITAVAPNQVARAGTNVDLCVTAAGLPPLSYQWWKDGTALANGGNLSGADAACLRLTGVMTNDSGNYRVVLSNSLGMATSVWVNLTVAAPPSIHTQPASVLTNAGALVLFSVGADGAPPPAYRWRKGAQNLVGGTNAVLILTNVQTSSTGSYSVVISNLAGSVTSAPAWLQVDAQAPSLAITSPTANQRVSNALFTVRGTASDNLGLAQVLVRLNGGPWQTASGGANWQHDVTLVPGTNTVSAYALDQVGNVSATRTLSFLYVVTDRLQVQKFGQGSLSPNLAGSLLPVGWVTNMTATPSNGHRFARWEVSTNWLNPVTVTSNKLTFAMQSNLTLTVFFLDTNRPAVTVASPTANQRISNAVFMARGTASDNVGVAEVWCCLNNGDWVVPAGTNAWTNILALVSGTNVLQVFATDAAGNRSLTNTVRFVGVLSPTNAVASLPTTAQWGGGSPASLQLTVQGGNARRVGVQFSRDLSTWLTVGVFTNATGTVQLPASQVWTEPAGFYRAVPLP